MNPPFLTLCFSSKLPPTLNVLGSAKMSPPAPLLQLPPWQGGHIHCYVSNAGSLGSRPLLPNENPSSFRVELQPPLWQGGHVH